MSGVKKKRRKQEPEEHAFKKPREEILPGIQFLPLDQEGKVAMRVTMILPLRDAAGMAAILNRVVIKQEGKDEPSRIIKPGTAALGVIKP